MSSDTSILVVAQPGAPWLVAFNSLAVKDGWVVSVQETTLNALTWLDQNDPRAILIDSAVSRSLSLCIMARAKPLLVDVPVIALVPEVDDAAFSQWLAVGVDDVLPATAPSRMARRLLSMPVGSLRPPSNRGLAVVADSDPSACDMVGRVLGQAGYDVRLALDAAQLCEYAEQPDAQLVVASTGIGDAHSLIQRVRRGGSLPAWVIRDPALEPWANPRPFGKLERVVIMSARAQPGAFLFASNALLLAAGRNARGSERLLFGTTVAYRVVGKLGLETGYSFNLSATGLFVRTLAPPPLGPVQIELVPPNTGVRHRYDGEVVWTRPFGSLPGATTPPGFGIRLVRGHLNAMEVWLQAYDALAASTGAPPPDASESRAHSDPAELLGAVTNAGDSAPGLLFRPAEARANAQEVQKPSEGRRPRLPPPRPGRVSQPPARNVPNTPNPSAPTTAAPKPPKPSAEVVPIPIRSVDTIPAPKQFPPTVIEPLPVLPLPKVNLDIPSPPVEAPTPEAKLAHGFVEPDPFAPVVRVEPPPAAVLPLADAAPAEVPVHVAAAAPAPERVEPSALMAVIAPPVQAGPVPKSRSLLSPRLVANAVFGSLVMAAAAGWYVFMRDGGTNPGPVPISAASAPPPTSAAMPALPLSTAVAPPTTTPSAGPSVSGVLAPAASLPATSESAYESDSPPPAGACPQPDEREAQSVLSYQGQLIVCSSASLDVYASGILVGKTNEKLVARCFMKYVRLGEGEPVTWRSKGQTVTIPCRGAVRVTIEPGT